MSTYDTLLVAHVLAAFAMGVALVLFTVTMLVARGGGRQAALAGALARPATLLMAAGAALTLVFGVWLAIYVDGYELWDGWIVAALIFFFVGAATGARAGAEARKAGAAAGEARPAMRRAMVFHWTATAAYVLVLGLMIFKPGAP